MSSSKIRDFSNRLLSWYDQSKRDLPWRKQSDPYAIWVSEIMLQQTRVDTVIPYYNRFMRQLPSMDHLAKASDEELLKLWEGLGYYSRVFNLRKAAQEVVDKLSGVLPSSYSELIKLPGIGDYTANAILSIAYQQSVVAVDGNVLRVFARLFAIEEDLKKPDVKKQIRQLIEAVLPNYRNSDFTQGLMELGATVCLPNGTPLCDQCPFHKECIARQQARTDQIPVKARKATRVHQSITVVIFCNDEGKVYIRKRPNSGLLKGLWEFYLIEESLTVDEINTRFDSYAIPYQQWTDLGKSKHIFSHIEWMMQGYLVEIKGSVDFGVGIWKKIQDLEQVAFPTALKGYLELLRKVKH